MFYKDELTEQEFKNIIARYISGQKDFKSTLLSISDKYVNIPVPQVYNDFENELRNVFIDFNSLEKKIIKVKLYKDITGKELRDCKEAIEARDIYQFSSNRYVLKNIVFLARAYGATITLHFTDGKIVRENLESRRIQ